MDHEHARDDGGRLLRAAFVNAPFGIAVYAPPEMRFVQVNPAGCAMLGRSEEELLRCTIWDVLHPDDAVLTREHIREVPLGTSVDLIERRFVWPDGRVVVLRGNARAVTDEAGRTVAYVGQYIDVTEEKRREAERAALEDELRRAQRLEAVGRLAGGVAHDFNNMLAVILNSANLARSRTHDPRLGELLAYIHQAATRSADLSRQLMILGRQEAEEADPLDLNEAIRSFAPLLRRTVGEDVALELDLADDLPPVPLTHAHIQQILMNLATNARDAIPGHGRLTLRTRRTAGGATQEVSLVCADDGEGIDEQVLDRIFEPYFTTKGSRHGTGLGLSVVYTIVKKAGGHVRVESRPGEGTRFELLLPATAPTSRRPPAPQPDDGMPGGRGERVLLVEDEPQLLSMLEQILVEFGYAVVAFGDPLEALDWLRGEAPVDLLLTDVVMPGISGAQLAMEGLRARPGLRVLLTSGHTSDRLSQHDLTRRWTLLLKPFQAADLLRIVRAVLDQPA